MDEHGGIGRWPGMELGAHDIDDVIATARRRLAALDVRALRPHQRAPRDARLGLIAVWCAIDHDAVERGETVELPDWQRFMPVVETLLPDFEDARQFVAHGRCADA